MGCGASTAKTASKYAPTDDAPIEQRKPALAIAVPSSPGKNLPETTASVGPGGGQGHHWAEGGGSPGAVQREAEKPWQASPDLRASQAAAPKNALAMCKKYRNSLGIPCCFLLRELRQNTFTNNSP